MKIYFLLLLLLIFAKSSYGQFVGTPYIFKKPIGFPTLSTTAASSITATTALSGGTISADGGATVTARGVVWSTSTGPDISLATKTSDGTGTSTFTSSLTGLTGNSTYYVRAYATNSAGTAYGAEVSFITLLAIGDSHQGGIIFYLDGNGGGLVVATSDQSVGAQWGCKGTAITGADGQVVGTGAQNTIDIVAECTTSNIAADICANLTLESYTDWFLPSLDELVLSNNTIRVQAGFADAFYWSSTENSENSAKVFLMRDGAGIVIHQKMIQLKSAVSALFKYLLLLSGPGLDVYVPDDGHNAKRIRLDSTLK